MKRIELNENEEQVLIQFIDLAVKASGVNSVKAAAHFLMKIEQAENVEPEELPEL